MKKIIWTIIALSIAMCAMASETWTLTADKFGDKYYGAAVANGGIGIIPWNKPFSIERVCLNGVYDTRADHGTSCTVLGINPFQITMKVGGIPVSELEIRDFRQILDMRRAVHSSSFTIPGTAGVRYDVRALRQLARTGMIVVEVKAMKDIDVEFSTDITYPGKYYSKVEVFDRDVKMHKEHILCRKAYGKTAWLGKDVCVTSSLIVPGMPETEDLVDGTSVKTTIEKGKSFRVALIAAEVSSDDVEDPFNEADREYILARHQGIDTNIELHERLWDELWQGDVEIDGDDDAQRTVRFALYNLYSACREGSGQSIPPFGLTSNGYSGHIFWDTEMWMYPPMLFLNSGIAESMMNYRTDRLGAAIKRASLYGYKGAMFPWESDREGVESCPTSAICGVLEHHITGDVAIAAWNYYLMTRDQEWLKDRGWPLLRECAKFWTSRVRDNGDGSYSIVDVSGPDEYAVGVTDNAFTNGAAISSLKAAVKAAAVLGYKAPAEWSEIADGIRILHSEKEGITLEFEGYDGRKVKQADVNLLAYPLQLISDSDQVLRDLEYYGRVIDVKGPAMSFAILALQYARLGDGQKAYELFFKSYSPNRLPPFGVISEGAGGTNPYFCTGAGGLLQTVINGFCGLELTESGIVQLPAALPPHWKSVSVKGVGPERKTYTNTR